MAAARINIKNTTAKNVYVEDVGYERRLMWRSGTTISVLAEDIDLSYSIQKLITAGILEVVA